VLGAVGLRGGVVNSELRLAMCGLEIHESARLVD
jgi:hypothetical protein